VKIISNLTSYIFHPLLSIIYAVLIVLYPFGFLPIKNIEVQWITLGIIFLFSFILPTGFILVLKFFKIISSIKLEDRRERWLPYLFVSLYYLFIWYYIKKISLFEGVIATAFLLSSILIFALFIINHWIKISAHVLSVCAILGLVLRLTFHFNELNQLLILILCIFTAGLVATSRLYLNAHTTKEVLFASILGTCLGIFSFQLL
jgi:membrane-associated phospholipid phosphatase